MKKPSPRIAMLISVAAAPVFACTAPATPDEPEHVAQPTPIRESRPVRDVAGLELVANAQDVCMVNDTFMGRAQIPVTVSGKTYYGCCAMCERRLATDDSVRFANDPFTGERVDKALAVIARTESGSVLYFASVESFERYAETR